MRGVILSILALTALAFATANPLSLTVTVNAPLLFTVDVEQVAFEVFDLEFSYGLSVRTNYDDLFTVAPFLSVVKYGDVSSWWLEFTVPSGVWNYVGLKPYWFTFGFQYRW